MVQNSQGLCPCCGQPWKGNARSIDVTVRYDEKELNRPILIRDIKDENPITEVQHCKKSLKFYDLKPRHGYSKQGKLIFKIYDNGK